ncbi:MAG TPA: cupin domain-containing protein [Actinomycetota bacterium]|nr:cupin domain-containing protein [Actinomycetota bacterium]
MSFRHEPWPGDEPPDEHRVKSILAREGLSGYRWSNGPGDRYGAHSHPYTKVLYCLQGGIAFHLDTATVNLRPGDRLEVEAGEIHSADVGPAGVVCFEAARSG